MTKTFINIFILIIISNSCNNVENANKKPKANPDTEQSDFVSKVFEPQDKTYMRFQYFDFLEPRCHKFEQVNENNYQDVQILEIRKIALDDFFEIEDKLINLEALMIVYTQIGTEEFEQLMESLASKKYFKKLILNHNGFKTIPASISRLKGLITLDLSFQDYPELPEEITELPNLSYLRVAKNKQLRSLPTSLGNLSNLEILDFAGTSVREFPSSIGNCAILKNITANACQIRSIPSQIGKLTELRDINLGYNKIKEIPKEMGKLTKLIGLYIGNNQLSEIPDEFRNLTNLEICGFPLNNLREFPSAILNAKNLRTLTLYDNEFTNIPQELSGLKKLEILYIDVPKMNKLDLETIKTGLPSLDIRNK